MVRTDNTGATAPATRAAVVAGACILDLQREVAARGLTTAGNRRGRSGRGRNRIRYNVPPYFPSDVC